MSALVFLVRGRSVDLVSMTAGHALRESLEGGERVLSLQRDDLIVLEGARAADAAAWTDACTAHANWFNPNKHRFAMAEAEPGAHAAALGEGKWPQPWLRRILRSDRPDLAARGSIEEAALEAWTGPAGDGAQMVTLVAWDREDADSALPAGHWPDAKVRVLPLVAWTLRLRADDPASASALALDLAVTRDRRHGLLVHPHMQGWSVVQPFPGPKEAHA